MRDIPVSVVIPVRNEEANIAKCLGHLQRFSEIVVVDSGSTDSTIEICSKFRCVVLNFDWNGKFPKKRNWALRNYNFKTDWILFLDADEQVTDRFVSELETTLETTKYVGFWLTYDNCFMGRPLRFGVPQRKLALFKRDAGEYERINEDQWSRLDMEIHEHPVVSGPVGTIGARILHDDYKSLSKFIGRHNEYSDWEARRFLEMRNGVTKRPMTQRQRVKYALLRSRWFGALYFVYTYFIRGGFLDGRSGFDYAVLKAGYFYSIALKISEINDIRRGSV